MDEVIRCKTAAENLIAGLLCPIQCIIFFIENQSAELKNCSKKTPGFERCECLQNMDESNADRVKVKLNRSVKVLAKKGKKLKSDYEIFLWQS